MYVPFPKMLSRLFRTDQIFSNLFSDKRTVHIRYIDLVFVYVYIKHKTQDCDQDPDPETAPRNRLLFSFFRIQTVIGPAVARVDRRQVVPFVIELSCLPEQFLSTERLPLSSA